MHPPMDYTVKEIEDMPMKSYFVYEVIDLKAKCIVWLTGKGQPCRLVASIVKV